MKVKVDYTPLIIWLLPSLGLFMISLSFVLPATYNAYKLSSGNIVLRDKGSYQTFDWYDYMVYTSDGPVKVSVYKDKPQPFVSSAKTTVRTTDINGRTYFNWSVVLWLVQDRLLDKLNCN